jgi:D-glycero-alpha-D-manno-heptose-7-phosphate kinase
MKIVRAPVRLTLGGGGTDLPAWYNQHGGFLISAAINKYIYFTGGERPFDRKIWLSYSKVEVCDNHEQVQHELLQRCIARYNLKKGIEIHSISEVPGSTGLGSSGSFLVGTLTLLNSLFQIEASRKDVAEAACDIEMKELKRSSGKQDQYIAAYGGIVGMTLDKEGNVTVERLPLSDNTYRSLENNLLIYFSGVRRDANEILSEQSSGIKVGEDKKLKAMMRIQEIGFLTRDALLKDDVDQVGHLMHDHWVAKKEISGKMSSNEMDVTYDQALAAGALGGKLIGAGGGGYWLFYVQPEKQNAFRQKMNSMSLIEMNWSFDTMGCSVVYSS